MLSILLQAASVQLAPQLGQEREGKGEPCALRRALMLLWHLTQLPRSLLLPVPGTEGLGAAPGLVLVGLP